MKKQLISLLVVFSSGFIAILFLLGHSFLEMSDQSYGAKMMAISDKPKFFPSDITSVTWVHNRVKQVLSRSKNSLLWNSAYGQQIIHKRLHFFSSLKGHQIGPLENIEGSLTLGFQDASAWKAVFNRHSFRWISGPYQGEGGRLSEENAYVLATGKYLFKQGPLKWCDQHIIALIGKSQLTKDRLNSWLKESCSPDIDYMLDLQTMSYHQFSNKYNLTLHGNEKATIKWNNNNLIYLDYPNRKLLFVSKDLRKQLDKIAVTPLKGK